MMPDLSKFTRNPQDMVAVGDRVFEFSTHEWATERSPDRSRWYTDVVLLNPRGGRTNTKTRVEFTTYPESARQRKRLHAAAVALSRAL
jgi:hypothetical protein